MIVIVIKEALYKLSTYFYAASAAALLRYNGGILAAFVTKSDGSFNKNPFPFFNTKISVFRNYALRKSDF